MTRSDGQRQGGFQLHQTVRNMVDFGSHSRVTFAAADQRKKTAARIHVVRECQFRARFGVRMSLSVRQHLRKPDRILLRGKDAHSNFRNIGGCTRLPQGFDVSYPGQVEINQHDLIWPAETTTFSQRRSPCMMPFVLCTVSTACNTASVR